MSINTSETNNVPADSWLKDLRDKIYAMFRSPLKEDYNNEVFKWISTLCVCKKRFSWLCNGERGLWTKETVKIFSCIARLSIIELHILLPKIQRHLICGDQIDMEDGKVMAKSANSNDYSNFGVHLHILEETIQTLVHGQSNEERPNSNVGNILTDLMDSNELKSLLERMKEIIGQLFDYLELVCKNWSKLVVKVEDEKFQAGQAALRIVSIWISEDTSQGFQPQVERFLMDLLVKNLLLINRIPDTNFDLLIMALHSICVDEPEMHEAFKKTASSQIALQKYLDYVQQQNQKDNCDLLEGKIKKKAKLKEFKLRCALIKDLL